MKKQSLHFFFAAACFFLAAQPLFSQTYPALFLEKYKPGMTFPAKALPGILQKYKQENRQHAAFQSSPMPPIARTLDFRGTEWLLDSIHCSAGSGSITTKFYYSHDDNGRKIQQIKIIQYANGTMQTERERYFYDAQGRLEITLLDSGQGSDWVPVFRFLYSYDAVGRLEMEKWQNWSGTGWDEGTRYLFSYDANDRLLQKTSQIFDGFSWQDNERERRIYLSAFAQADSIWYEANWGGTGLFTYLLDVFQFSTSGLPASSSQWTTFSDVVPLEEETRHFFTYDADLRLTEVRVQGNNFCDTPTWKDAYRCLYAYDAAGNLVEQSVKQQFIPQYGEWIDNERELWEYDAAGNLVEERREYAVPDPATAEWLDFKKTDLFYNASGRLTLQEGYNKPLISSDWTLNYSDERLYDAQGLQVEQVVKTYDECAGNLKNSSRQTFDYGGGQQPVGIVSYIWIDSASEWSLYAQSIYSYNTFDSVEQITEQVWEPVAEVWKNSRSFLFTYDAQNRLVERLRLSWNPFSQVWRNFQLWTYSYTPEGKIDKELRQFYLGGAWSNSSRRCYTYDANGYLVEVLSETWKNDEWATSSKSVYINNPDGTPASWELFSWNNDIGLLVPNIRTYLTYDAATGKLASTLQQESKENGTLWFESESCTQFWSEFTTSAVELPSASLDCRLANPYVPGSLILCEGAAAQPKQLFLYDLPGRLQVEQSFTGQTTIEQPLAPGIYVLLVKDDQGGVFRRKIVVP